jgi:hypothetical protein
VHEVLEIGALVFGPAPVKDHLLAAGNRDRRVIRTHVHEQPVAGRSRAAAEQTQQRQRHRVHEASVDIRLLADCLVLPNDFAARQLHDELPAAVAGLHPRSVRHARIVNGKWRCLAKLPPDQLIQVVASWRYLVEAKQRDLHRRVRYDERDTAHARPEPLDHLAQGARDGCRIVKVGRRQ